MSELIGTWILESIYYKDANNEKVNLYGDDPNGILMYDAHGYMNAQIGYKNREHLGRDELNSNSSNKKQQAFDTFTAYYGTYKIIDNKTVVHTVIGCTIPDWEKGDEIRFFSISGNKMKINTPETKINGFNTVIEVEWLRC